MSFDSSRHFSISGMISCSPRIARSTRASVENPVLPRRLRLSSSFSNRIRASCCGEPIVNSSPASSQMRCSSSSISSDDARRGLAQQVGVELHALALEPVEHLDERQLDLVQQPAQLQPVDLLLLVLRTAPVPASASARPARPLDHRLDARLVHQLVERIAPPRRVDQVGGHRRVPCRAAPCRRLPSGSPGAGPASRATVFQSCATSGRSPHAPEQLGKRGSGPGQDLAVARRGPAARRRPRAARPAARRAGQLGDASLRARSPRRAARPSRRGAAVCSPERLLEAAQRIAQLEVVEHLAQPRAVGRRGRRSPSRPRPASMSRWRVASCFERRARSAFSRRFSLRFAPEMSSMCASTSSSDPYCCSS